MPFSHLASCASAPASWRLASRLGASGVRVSPIAMEGACCTLERGMGVALGTGVGMLDRARCVPWRGVAVASCGLPTLFNHKPHQ